MPKATYEYIVRKRPRKPEWPERSISLPKIIPPPPGGIENPEYLKWWEENEWLINFAVHVSNLSRAKELAKELWAAWEQKDEKRVQKLLERLRLLQVVPFEKLLRREKWTHMAVQLPEDIGGPNKKKIREILSTRYKGCVLEAMCGFNSYFEPSQDRGVTALDFCREALELYPYPERERILFDLNAIRGRGMPFFKSGSFDVVAICFGFNYLRHPVTVLRELRRILARGGRIVLVENPVQGYLDMLYRRFSPTQCIRFLKQTLFKKIEIEELPIAEDWEVAGGGRYFLIEARRN